MQGILCIYLFIFQICSRGMNPQALVLAPTRELAKQVEKEFRDSSNLDTICVYGGVPIQSQIRTLGYGVDVVAGTPGRIIDLIKRGALNLKEVQFVVLDEADQMLAVGFDEAVEVILDHLPKNRQSMMFSATMPSWIRKLTQKYLKDPVTIDLVSMLFFPAIHTSNVFLVVVTVSCNANHNFSKNIKTLNLTVHDRISLQLLAHVARII